jgi:hypothetical protein
MSFPFAQVVLLTLCNNIAFIALSFDTSSNLGNIKTTKGAFTANIYVTNNVFFDKNSVKYKTISNYKEKSVFPDNTHSSSIGLGITRNTKWSFLYGIEIEYGNRNYSVNFKKSISDFDPKAKFNLNDRYVEMNVSSSARYIGLRYLIGYNLKINKKINTVVKCGLGKKMFYDGLWESKTIHLKYNDDIDPISYSSQYLDVVSRLGRNPYIDKSGLIGRNRFPKWFYSFELFLGVEKKIDFSYIKTVSIGIESCQSIISWLNDGEITFMNSIQNGSNKFDYAYFYDRNKSLGIRISLGIGKYK